MQFEGSFEESCMETYVPQSLIDLVSMIEHSPDIEIQIKARTKPCFAISQFLQYNFHQSPKKNNTVLQNHSKVVKHHVGLLLFAKQGSVS